MEFIRKPLWALFALLALGCQQTQTMEKEESEQCYILQIPVEMQSSTINEMFFMEKTDKTNFRDIGINLSLVCKTWSGIIKKDAKRWVCEYFNFNIDGKEKDNFWRLFKGKLIYKPNPNSDEKRVDFFISALPSPLEGAFDLSNCGDAGKYLNINMGYRKGQKEENDNKLEIWLPFRPHVENELEITAQHFKEIFPEKWYETAPVGIFWTWGSWNDLSWYDYLTTENMDDLSKIDLYENWKKSVVSDAFDAQGRARNVERARGARGVPDVFMFHL